MLEVALEPICTPQYTFRVNITVFGNDSVKHWQLFQIVKWNHIQISIIYKFDFLLNHIHYFLWIENGWIFMYANDNNVNIRLRSVWEQTKRSISILQKPLSNCLAGNDIQND